MGRGVHGDTARCSRGSPTRIRRLLASRDESEVLEEFACSLDGIRRVECFPRESFAQRQLAPRLPGEHDLQFAQSAAGPLEEFGQNRARRCKAWLQYPRGEILDSRTGAIARDRFWRKFQGAERLDVLLALIVAVNERHGVRAEASRDRKSVV